MTNSDHMRGAGAPATPAQGLPLYRASMQRILFLKIALLLIFLVIVARLVDIQVLKSAMYKEEARKQYQAVVPLPAMRGNIFDRNGALLASNARSLSFAADPVIVGNKMRTVAEEFALSFDRPRDTYLTRLSTLNTRFVWLERRVNPLLSKRVLADTIPGVIKVEEPQRLYHYDYVAGQLIGFTDVDNKGLSGVELQFDRELQGKDGHVIMQRVGQRRIVPSVDYPRVSQVNGNSIVLTIDLEFQSIAEQELRKGIERNKAEGGLVVMLDPTNGEVLAMANDPSLNPSDASHADQALMRNRAITDMFEPGSIFKIVTAAGALEYNLVKPEQRFFAEQGRYLVPLPGGKTHLITDTHEYGMISFQQAMELSSNIVMAKVSDKIGAERMYRTARDFGFGTATGIELPGEVSGVLKKPNEWSGTTLNTMAYGYEVSVTPLQIAAAYGAVANKGVLMKPFIMKKIIDERQQVIAETRPQEIRRVISKATALTLTQFFQGVVQRGTGVSARVPGFAIAGKTGTARRAIAGKYEAGSYTASFVGFFPADDPRVVCLVMLDNPREGGYTGGLASAPIFKGIAERLYARSGRFSRRPAPAVAADGRVAVPDVMALNIDVGKTLLAAQGYGVDIQGRGKVIRSQSPKPGTTLQRGKVVTLGTNDAVPTVLPGYAIVPDLRGLPMRRAINALIVQQLEMTISGSGVVAAQYPAAGGRVKVGTRIVLYCEPKDLSGVNL